MTGPEHYREAERLLEALPGLSDAVLVPEWIARAQVHATLALAAATALPHAGDLPVADHDAWWAAAGSEPVYRSGNEVTP